MAKIIPLVFLLGNLMLSACSTNTHRSEIATMPQQLPSSYVDAFSRTLSCIQRSLRHQYAPRTLLLASHFSRDNESLSSMASTWLVDAMRFAAPKHIVVSESLQKQFLIRVIQGEGGLQAAEVANIKKKYAVDQILIVTGEFPAFDQLNRQESTGTNGESTSQKGGTNINISNFNSEDVLTFAMGLSFVSDQGADTVDRYIVAKGVRNRQAKTVEFGLGYSGIGLGYAHRKVHDDALQNGLQAALVRYSSVGLLQHLYEDKIDQACLYGNGHNSAPPSRSLAQHKALAGQDKATQITQLQQFLVQKALLGQHTRGQLDTATMTASHRYQWLVGLMPSGHTLPPAELLQLLRGHEAQWVQQIQRYRNFQLVTSAQRFAQHWIFAVEADVRQFRDPKIDFVVRDRSGRRVIKESRYLAKYQTKVRLQWDRQAQSVEVFLFDGPVLIEKKRVLL